ncbi:hypothetical protein CDL15_Pgr019362 [Punica granatum]|uniref:Uncharacterized protein n=1 Tax=Punica granatum TaxID=22663 RepID=A0A218X5Y5_PUNGR|nr:hypothetical protein CDL15_Pgr019362 [Punica granatum]
MPLSREPPSLDSTVPIVPKPCIVLSLHAILQPGFDDQSIESACVPLEDATLGLLFALRQSPSTREDPTEPPQTKTGTPIKTSPNSGTATMVDLTNNGIDYLRRKAAEKDEELTN